MASRSGRWPHLFLLLKTDIRALHERSEVIDGEMRGATFRTRHYRQLDEILRHIQVSNEPAETLKGFGKLHHMKAMLVTKILSLTLKEGGLALTPSPSHKFRYGVASDDILSRDVAAFALQSHHSPLQRVHTLSRHSSKESSKETSLLLEILSQFMLLVRVLNSLRNAVCPVQYYSTMKLLRLTSTKHTAITSPLIVESRFADMSFRGLLFELFD